MEDVRDDLTVVVITRDRRDAVLRCVDRLLALPDRPRVVVVDNGSSDGTSAALRARRPELVVVPLAENAGAVGRTVGARVARTRYVAFADDDSGWDPGSLATARDILDAHPRVGLLAARVLVGEEGRPDPVSAHLAASPLGTEPGAPGRSVLGFLSCSAVVRREAFLAVGGFHPLLFFFGEEDLLAQDLVTAGWQVCHVPDVVATHDPGVVDDRRGRRRLGVRNALLTAWLRRSLPSAAARSAQVLLGSGDPVSAAGGLLDAVARVPRVVAGRRPLPAHVEESLRALAVQP